MEYAVLVLLIVLAAMVVLWQVTARRRVFVIQVRKGVPFLKRGKVTSAFVAELADALGHHGVRRGAVYGVNKNGRVALGFSRAIPQTVRQSLRNVWSMHGR